MGPTDQLRTKLDHRWSRGRMSDYVDDDLSSRDRRRLERHTEICPECRRALRTLAVVVSELRRLRRAERPGVAAGVVERLRNQSNEQARIRSGR